VSILEQELALIKSCFAGNYIKKTFENYNKMLLTSFFSQHYISVFSYPKRMQNLEESSMYNVSDKGTYWFIQLLENNRLNNGAATTKTDFINMFKHYAQEVNNYIF
jgi:hypothetical protein